MINFEEKEIIQLEKLLIQKHFELQQLLKENKDLKEQLISERETNCQLTKELSYLIT